MSNYKEQQSYTVNNFQLSLYPYVAVPDNRFESNAAIQYGADFKVDFQRAGIQKNKLGLIQLIFPQTALFQNTVVGAWNVDKRQPANNPITMGGCLYSDDLVRIGAHSTNYAGQYTRSMSETECWLIDTPREIKASFNMGIFNGVTNTKFANYIVELSNKNGVVFNQGIVWGYSVAQNSQNLAQFEFLVQPPRKVMLLDTSEHLAAIALFLGSTKDAIKGYIS